MKQLLVLAFVFFWASTVFAADFGDATVNRMYQSILDTRDPAQKVKKGRTLGCMGSPVAVRALNALLEDASYWNREAGAAGLLYSRDAANQELLLAHFVNDFMIEDFIKKGIRGQWTAFFPTVKRAYNTENDEKKRLKLLQLMLSVNDQASRSFLQSVVAKTNAEDRQVAFDLLAESAQPEDAPFLRSFLADPQLKPSAMAYVLTHGTADDLEIFTPYLDFWQDELTVMSYVALNQWGSPEQKEHVFFNALSSPNREQTLSAMKTFKDVTSERVLLRLGDMSQNSSSQTVRRLACMNLLYFDDQRIVPFLERFLKEPYMPRKKDGWDAFMTQMTLGTSAVVSYLYDRKKEEAFRDSREKIMQKIIELK